MNLIILQDAMLGINLSFFNVTFWVLLNYFFILAGFVIFFLLYLRVMKYLKKSMEYMDHKMRSGE